jgi:hypothetical protein
MVQPTDAGPETPNAALVPGEYWQVLTVAGSDEAAIAHAINDAGVIVGTIVRDGHSHPIPILARHDDRLPGLAGSLDERKGHQRIRTDRRSARWEEARALWMRSTTPAPCWAGRWTSPGHARYFTWTTFGGMKDRGSWALFDTYGALSDKGRIVGTETGGRTFTISGNGA